MAGIPIYAYTSAKQPILIQTNSVKPRLMKLDTAVNHDAYNQTQIPRMQSDAHLMTLMSLDPEIHITVETFVSATAVDTSVSASRSFPLTFRPRPPPLPQASPVDQGISSPQRGRAGQVELKEQPIQEEGGDVHQAFSPHDLLSPPANTWKAPRDQFQSDGQTSSPHPHRPRRQPPPVRRWSTPNTTPDSTSVIPKPLPTLFRPTTFWRRTRRSAVTAPSYSPARHHLVRRSSFVAAGLAVTHPALDRPFADLSAYAVEIRSKALRREIVLIPESEILV